MSHPFGRGAVRDIADVYGVDERALADAAASVQAAVGNYPGATIDGLVYEWRQAFAEDPLVERTPTRWVLLVPERVWTDLCERGGVRDDLRPVLAALHASAFTGERDEDDERVPLVLARS
ncbi:hypothetical protein [Halobacterium litoreum]|uniref:DUF8048 domain-containing protein n=1 Tax=Halobacterium litoreum TaxID=2039234 RepID=A0ABD5NBH2_9EURY|nr:hypothetical protein [Halobacterium litoreum]UHH14719.1 hypothetical protein LT972_06880 [Halobacterium litoreum]